MRGGDAALPKLLWEDLLTYLYNEWFVVSLFKCKQTVAPTMYKQRNSVCTDHDDVENEAERHLRQHQVERSVDVVDAHLIQRLTPVDQTEH